MSFFVNSTLFCLLPVFLVLVGKQAGANEPWKPLFNGKDLDGWHTMFEDTYGKDEDPQKVFQVHDGMIHIYKDLAHGSDTPWGTVGTNKEYSDYRLRFQYKWGEKKFGRRTNEIRDSGLLYHCVGPIVVWPTSVECQVQEGDTGDIYTVRTRMTTTTDPDKQGNERLSYYKEGGVEKTQGNQDGIGRVVKSATPEVDGWNTVEVIIDGDTATHIVNGEIVNRCTRMQIPDPKDPDKWVPLTKGRICFQAEGAEIFYRDIEIKSLDPKK